VRQFNGRLSQIPWRRIFLFVSICQSCGHLSPPSYIVSVELWYLHLWTGFQFSGAPEPQSMVLIICFLSISGAPNTRIAEEFMIFTELTMLNNLLSTVPENRNQHLNSPETDPAQYISNHPRIERLSKQYRVNLLYGKRWLAYSRLTWRIQLSVSSLKNEVQAHLRFTLLPSLIVSDMTPHSYSIQRLIETISHSLLTYDSTPGMPLNHVFPLHITFERFILLHSKHISFLCECFDSVAASTQSVILQTLKFWVQARLIPLGPSSYLNLCLIGMWRQPL